LIPPSLIGPPAAEMMARLANWLKEQHGGGVALGSVCAGAFLLAETGLLAGRPATTHWSYAETFVTRYPEIGTDTDKLIIDDGDIITAGGLMAWIDLGLKVVARLLGPTIALETARYLLVDPAGREQRFYSSFSPKLHHGDKAVLKVQHWLQAQGTRHVTLSDMAKQAGLEERTFLRRFQKATGLKPTEYCQHLCIEKARERLEFSKLPVEQIAWSVGYEDAGAFRKVFQKVMGLSPGDYRRRFAVGSAEVTAE
jgi:transcriptional regulator GlxA family with amidase domain